MTTDNAHDASSTTASSATKRPKLFISANQVTVARILALPFPCYALLGTMNEAGVWVRPNATVMWFAFVFGAIVGATDFVDGWMARRDGPTTLGALLDPVADKLFVALLLLPVVAHAECPGWAAGALFVRELLITSLRSSMALRDQRLKTSSLGKLKTVVQMGGIAVFFLTIFVPADAMPWSIFGCGVFFAVLAAGWYIRRRTLPLWLLATPLLLWACAAAAFFRPAKEAGLFVFVLMVFFTWISGLDYLTGSVRAFRATGGVRLPDVTRVLWSFAHGLALVPLLGSHPRLALPVIISLSAELSLGGIENLVTAERKRWARGSVIPTMVAAYGVGICAWFELVSADTLTWAAWGLAAFSVVNMAAAFFLDRDVFMGKNSPLV